MIVGAGNLGQALAGYGGFNGRGFPVSGIVDIDPDKVGIDVAGTAVRALDDLPGIVAAGGIRIGVVATPAVAAQHAAELLIDAGVTSILNFAPVVLSVPSTITVRKVDLAVELQILSYHEQRKGSPGTRTADGAQLHALPADRQRGASA